MKSKTKKDSLFESFEEMNKKQSSKILGGAGSIPNPGDGGDQGLNPGGGGIPLMEITKQDTGVQLPGGGFETITDPDQK